MKSVEHYRAPQRRPGLLRGVAVFVALACLCVFGPSALAQDSGTDSAVSLESEERGDAVAQDNVNDEESEGGDEGEGGEEGEDGEDDEPVDAFADEDDDEDEVDEDESNLVEDTPPKKGEGIRWWPGWEVGARLGWHFTSLEELNPLVTDPNRARGFDAGGLGRFEIFGGGYLTKRQKMGLIFGGDRSLGGPASTEYYYLAGDFGFVFPEHRFEFLLGLRGGVGMYSMDTTSWVDESELGYEGVAIHVEPYLGFRYIFTMNIAMDVTVSFWQHLPVTDDPTGTALPVDELSIADNRPKDWAAPSLTIGFVYGEMPKRKPAPLSPTGDKDDDGVANAKDKCPKDPEDEDGFQDEDGCPDKDNDEDGVEDAKDTCPDEPEDMDGVMDADGCPETDGDEDGFLDEKDQCPEKAEDKDGFQDEDGCPDEDNDGDTIPDAQDKCPFDPEDVDQFEDEDGCPDIDDDRDWVIDSGDQCKGEPETWNGINDGDGCPDKASVALIPDKKIIELIDPITFKGRNAKFETSSKVALDRLVALLKGAAHIKQVRVQVYANDRDDADKSKELSQKRADALVEYLIDQGVPKTQVIAAGMGLGDSRVELSVTALKRPPTFTPSKAPKPTR